MSPSRQGGLPEDAGSESRSAQDGETNDSRQGHPPPAQAEPSEQEQWPPSSEDNLLKTAAEFAKQSAKLSHQKPSENTDAALEARFVTPQDSALVTAEGHRLPAPPLSEIQKLNSLRDQLEDAKGGSSHHGVQGSQDSRDTRDRLGLPMTKAVAAAMGVDGTAEKSQDMKNDNPIRKSVEAPLRRSMPPSHTDPLFPPLPLYGPPSLMRNLQCATFRVSSFFLSLSFLSVIVLGALFTSLPPLCTRLFRRLAGRHPDAEDRPFYEEEQRRARLRTELDRSWRRRRPSQDCVPQDREEGGSPGAAGIDDDGGRFVPTEGGPDPVVCDVGYYARRVGLDVEEFEVQTEDGFVIDLWHVFDPSEYEGLPPEARRQRGPDVFTDARRAGRALKNPDRPRKFPVLLMHGLLQSAGAYCCNDDDSLAFYLCKSGYDVWLGNNRCGFNPKHTLLEYSDPRMWCWNIRQMGVFDLPALTLRVLSETGFAKLGLVCHSQGTTQTFVALAKEQRPELGEKLTVFCALAPAAYAGPLIGKMYFKFMRVITPSMFRMVFGIHAFIPIMMRMHRMLPPRLYGWMGYKVFWFLFNWSDSRWDRGLRDRMFQFAPVYVSAESMRWWLGRECFARHKCILSTKEEWKAEDREDAEAEGQGGEHDVPHASATNAEKTSAVTSTHDAEKLSSNHSRAKAHGTNNSGSGRSPQRNNSHHHSHNHPPRRKPRGSTAWYNAQAPPFALWVCGRDDLVDGRKLLRRFQRPGREPHVRLVHAKVLPEFEHLDVIWAMDAPREVFAEIREVLWKTCDARDRCRVPRGCEDVAPWTGAPAPTNAGAGAGAADAAGTSAEKSPPREDWSGSSSEDLPSTTE